MERRGSRESSEVELKGHVTGWMWEGGERQVSRISVWAQVDGSTFTELKLEDEVRVLCGSGQVALARPVRCPEWNRVVSS